MGVIPTRMERLIELGFQIETAGLMDSNINPRHQLSIYVASSWRNTVQPKIVARLRQLGYWVYDFRNPKPGKSGFSWKQILPDDPSLWTGQTFREVLKNPIAMEAYACDANAVRQADVTVLVQPCGRSAFFELGMATGLGKHCAVLLQDGHEPELMISESKLCISLAELERYLDGLPFQAQSPSIDGGAG